MYFTADFRHKLAQGTPCIGPSITYADPTVTETLAPESVFLWIDTEHTALSLESVNAHLLAARACATPALVRVPANETSAIKRLLDIGVSGVIVPQIRTAEEVTQAVADMRYPPLVAEGSGRDAPPTTVVRHLKIIYDLRTKACSRRCRSKPPRPSTQSRTSLGYRGSTRWC